jgi:hypothetical protein
MIMHLNIAAWGNVTFVPYMTYTAADFGTSGLSKASRAATRSSNAQHTALKGRLTHAINEVADLKVRLGIEQRWTPEMPEYKNAEQHHKHRRFIRAVMEVEGLTVQRLFELAKANLAGTGIFVSITSVLVLLNLLCRLQNAETYIKGYHPPIESTAGCPGSLQQAGTKTRTPSPIA